MRRGVGTLWLLAFGVGTALAGAPGDAAPLNSGPGSLKLADALDLALRQNPALAAARARRGIAEAAVRTAGALGNPEISIERTRSSPHEVLMLTSPLPLGPRRGAAITLAESELAVVDFEIAAAMAELRRDVRVHYHAVAAADRSAAAGARELDAQRRLLGAAEERLAQGDVAAIEVKQAHLAVARAGAALQALESEARLARAALNADLGRDRAEPVVLAVGNGVSRAPLPELGPLLERAAQDGRDAKAFAQKADRARARLSLARASRMPEITAGAGLELDDPEFGHGAKYTLAITLPVLNRQQGPIAEAEAELSALAIEKEALRRRLESAVGSAWARAETARAQIDLHEQTLVPAARELSDLHAESYREGAVALVVVLETERALREVELGQAKAILDYETALADLWLAAGLEPEAMR